MTDAPNFDIEKIISNLPKELIEWLSDKPVWCKWQYSNVKGEKYKGFIKDSQPHLTLAEIKACWTGEDILVLNSRLGEPFCEKRPILDDIDPYNTDKFDREFFEGLCEDTWVGISPSGKGYHALFFTLKTHYADEPNDVPGHDWHWKDLPMITFGDSSNNLAIKELPFKNQILIADIEEQQTSTAQPATLMHNGKMSIPFVFNKTFTLEEILDNNGCENLRSKRWKHPDATGGAGILLQPSSRTGKEGQDVCIVCHSDSMNPLFFRNLPKYKRHIDAFQMQAFFDNPTLSKEEANDKAIRKYASKLPQLDQKTLEQIEGKTVHQFNNPSVKQNTSELDVISCGDLLKLEIEPVHWIIENYLPAGTSLLVGKPKKGKSWLSLLEAISIACGRDVYGYKVNQGEILFMGLEDNLRRLKERVRVCMTKMKLSEDEIKMLIENVHFAIACDRLGAGFEGQINKWMAKHPETKLIVVDMLKNITPLTKKTNIYEIDSEKGEMVLNLARQYDRTHIRLVHHGKKEIPDDPFDLSSGSTGLTGAFDSIYVIMDDNNKRLLFCIGKDIDISDPIELVMDSRGFYTLSGVRKTQYLDRFPPEQRKYIQAIMNGHTGQGAIAEYVGKGVGTVGAVLKELKDKGHIKNDGKGKPYRVIRTSDFEEFT